MASITMSATCLESPAFRRTRNPAIILVIPFDRAALDTWLKIADDCPARPRRLFRFGERSRENREIRNFRRNNNFATSRILLIYKGHVVLFISTNRNWKSKRSSFFFSFIQVSEYTAFAVIITDRSSSVGNIEI